MGARRAEAGGIGSGVDITAVAAAPYSRIMAVKNRLVFHMFQQLAITFFVMALGNAYRIEYFGNSRKTFRSCNVGKAGIKPVVFIVFSIGGSCQIGGGIADYSGRKISADSDGSAFEKFEKAFGMFFFLFGGFSDCAGIVCVCRIRIRRSAVV